MTAFEIRVGPRLVNVHYRDDDDMSARDYRKQLIAAGSSPSISVYKRAVGRYAFSDCARASKPEECE